MTIEKLLLFVCEKYKLESGLRVTGNGESVLRYIKCPDVIVVQPFS